MEQNRKPRSTETRETTARPKQWAPADKQAGFAYRWIRVSMLNNADPRNLSAKLREGWEPVRAEEQPALQLLVDPNSRFKDNIEVGGLLLCKTPIEFVQQRNEHFQKLTDDQTAAVDNSLMRANDPRMPLFNDKKSSVSFGKGK
jgi:hypothetical protein